MFSEPICWALVGQDQRKIDRTIVRGCAGGVWSKDECAIHDKK